MPVILPVRPGQPERGACVLIDLHDIDEQRIEFSDELELPVERLDPDLVCRADRRASCRGVWHHSAMRISFPEACGRRETCFARGASVRWLGVAKRAFLSSCDTPETQHADEVELGETEMDVIFLDGDQLDLTDLAAEQVMLSMPMRSLCRSDCAGLCPKCGANRNLDSGCSCEPETDPRWDALRALQEKPS